MINSETIKNSLMRTYISNIIFDPSILFIPDTVLTDPEQSEAIFGNLIKFMNIINDYNLNLYWNDELQQKFYQNYYDNIINYRPQIQTSFFQKLFPKLISINAEGYNQCNIISNFEFCDELSDCYSCFQRLAHFLIHNESLIGYFISIFQNPEDFIFSCIDCEDGIVHKPFLIKGERDVYNFLFNFLLIKNFPLKDDEINVKNQKITSIINLEIFTKNNFHEVEQEYEFIEDFWNSEFLYDEDEAFRRKSIDVLSTILLNPDTRLFRKHKLKNHYIEINGRKRPIKQYDIFHEYRLCGVDVTPRLLVAFFQNKIMFIKIIDRH